MKLLTIMNHPLSDKQREYAKSKLKVDDFLFLSKDVKKYLENISPTEDLSLEKLNLITEYISSSLKKGDFVLIQTEFGVTFYLVDFCIKSGFTPIYATSSRVYEERINKDGTVARKHIFKFVKFRKYIKFINTK